MAERAVDFAAREPVPGTPGIREVRPDSGAESFGFDSEVGAAGTIRKVGLRAEIDTSPPFGSVKEAVTRFGGSESWPPLYKLAEAFQGVEEFDIKKVEEQAAELEKDLIVKELETLDVLEELGTTKKIVEELKLQLQKEAMKCMTTPDEQVSTPAIKEINKEHRRNYVSNHEQMLGNSSPCPVSSPDLILMELKQAKLNLGRTITDLGVIQTSVESLNKRMKKEKNLLEKTRERLTSKFPAEVKKTTTNVPMENVQMNSQGEQFKKLAEVSRAMLGNEQSKVCIKTAEMRWIAAKKMEEAAKAAEALAFAEIKALSRGDNTSGYSLPEPEKITPSYEDPHQSPLPKKKVVHAMPPLDEANISKLSILKMMEDAAAEVKHSKQVLEEAVNRVEIANRKQLAAGEALRRWAPGYDKKGQATMYSPNRLNIFNPCEYQQGSSPLSEVSKPNFATDEPKPVLRPTVSMRDILSRKQAHQAEECVVKRQTDQGHNERQKVALSQMLQELREDLTFPKKPDINDCDDNQKQFFAQRRKFGFIHISLPLTKQSKKKMQPLNAI
ncbi:WEB family protein At2g40480 [Pistacia vera]|uniref:WEB family protein At2g40480 n=1 Tax=Pistacia vera TaxID=55513 RepID=UPI001262F289|nr:WEB family protein At2g40480 [Pistacia vera]